MADEKEEKIEPADPNLADEITGNVSEGGAKQKHGETVYTKKKK